MQKKPQQQSGRKNDRARNEGEGNKTAAREYNRETTAFTRSGRVEGKAREAEQAIESAEADALRRAEREGKSHSHGEDKLLKGGAKCRAE